MAKLFFGGGVADPPAPHNRRLHNADGLIAGVVAEVSQQDASSKDREMNRAFDAY
jgi:hypothetical protein